MHTQTQHLYIKEVKHNERQTDRQTDRQRQRIMRRWSCDLSTVFDLYFTMDHLNRYEMIK